MSIASPSIKFCEPSRVSNFSFTFSFCFLLHTPKDSHPIKIFACEMCAAQARLRSTEHTLLLILSVTTRINHHHRWFNAIFYSFTRKIASNNKTHRDDVNNFAFPTFPRAYAISLNQCSIRAHFSTQLYNLERYFYPVELTWPKTRRQRAMEKKLERVQ